MKKQCVTLCRPKGLAIVWLALGLGYAISHTILFVMDRYWPSLFWAIATLLTVTWAVNTLCWRVDLCDDAILYKNAFSRQRYSYAQIREIREVFSRAENQNRITIYFYNGKMLSLLSRYTNYNEAKKLLSKHCVIHSGWRNETEGKGTE